MTGATRGIEAVVFDVGETLVDETRPMGECADGLGVPRLTFFAVLGGIIARGEEHRGRVRPPPAGRGHPALQLAGSREASAARWATLPPLSIVNRIGGPKPGATTLLLGEPKHGADLPVLLFQRYGRGKAIAFTVQDSWLWQMAAEIPVEDLTHETLWRQLIRWLASGAPDPMMVTASPDRVEPGDSVTLTATVSDSAYVLVNGAAVTARVTDPGGVVDSVPLEWTVLTDGDYRGAFVARTPGMYHVAVEARRAGTLLGSGDTWTIA